MKFLSLILAGFFILAPLMACASPEQALQAIQLPKGFTAEIYAHVPGARSLEVAPDINTIFVGTRGNKVFAIDMETREPRIYMRGLKAGNGIAYRDGYLYIAEQHRIIRASTDGSRELKVLFSRLPDNPWHGWRYATFGPDGRLYIAVGSPCNICTPRDLQGTIIALTLPDGKPEIVAIGIRNSVGLAFHPIIKKLYFTDNGADDMGDDSPPDELNRLDFPGQNFGFPWYGGGTDRTPDFAGEALPEQELTPPVLSFGAHVAPLGLHFYSGSQFPIEYQNNAFVAQHGSWNRSIPVGYRVMRIQLDASGNPVSREPFLEGWLRGETKLGRPVDIAELPGGSLLVSDDMNGVIWRISYEAGVN